MQEMWLFGQLDTLGESQVQQQTDENAKEVAELLRKILEMRQGAVELAAKEEGVRSGESVDRVS